jgi:hypothetical protein
MGRPQQPELARSSKTDLDPDRIGTELEARKPLREGGRTGPVPPENEPGHRPEHDQDKPDPDAFAAKLSGEDRPTSTSPAEEVQTTPAKRPAGTPGWPESAPAPQDPGPLGSPEQKKEPVLVGMAVFGLRAARRGLEILERSVTRRWRR